LCVIFILSQNDLHLLLIYSLEFGIDELFLIAFLPLNGAAVVIDEKEATIIEKFSGIGNHGLGKASDHLIGF
jgi:hypothetical protein